MGAFVIAMVEHDRDTASDSFQQAIAVSPSSPLTFCLGGVALAYGCEAERAIDWGERAPRLSPFDRQKYCAYALVIANFLRGLRRGCERWASCCISQALLVAPLAKLGRMEEAT